jgi:diaminohydroxyphosphoribosylaminopyrimidine deaminase/5-amino-6-(5-phosphoribosylamino)uracil reductase
MRAELPPTVFSAEDTAWMSRALQLAGNGLLTTHPNPRVGCVLVRDGSNVGEGWHVRAGEPHAEVHALRAAGDAARGATAYVTLEPCAHTGRTPPCAEALVQAGIVRVVAAMRDPFGEVDGRGFGRLRAAGIAVESGLLREQAEELNIGFLNRVRRGRPWVRLKLAISLDGRVAMASGESQWITGPEARRDVHRFRAMSDVVLSGIGTVLADDPRLTVRDVPGHERQPARAILDRQGRTPPAAALLREPGDVMVFRHLGAPVAGAIDVPTPLAAGNALDLDFVLDELGRRGFNELLAECGGTLASALIRQDLVDELLVYQAPCLLGCTAQPMAALGIAALADRTQLRLVDAVPVGDDLRLRFRPRRPEPVGA